MVGLAILTLDNRKYPLIEFIYSASQPVDQLGKPSGRPSGFFIDLTIESDSSTALLEWALGNDAKDGVITFYKPDGMSKFNEIKFKKAYCIRHQEKFEANGKLPMRQIIRISEPRHDLPKDVIAPPKRVVQQEKQETRVQTIKLVTSLDLGSANDGSGANHQEGMLYGETYEFKVTDYTRETPEDKSSINWMYKYHSLSENKWIEKKLAPVGDTLKFTVNEKDMCGRFVYLRAYIKDAENEGELKVWKHNRFRFFDRMVVHEQIKNRVNDPWKINQAQTSLCGMAALYYAMAKHDPKGYEKLAKELFRTGEYAIGSYILKPHEKALSMYDVNTSYDNYMALKMPEIDWIVLATTRSKESLNDHFVYNGFENDNIDMLKAVNWPEMLTRMCKEVAGFSSAEAHGLSFNAINNKKRPISGRVHDYFSNSDLEELQAIDKAHKWGRTILMMIDADMIYNKSSYNSLVAIGNNSHWVVYEGGLQLFDAAGAITENLDNVKHVKFKIYTWGEDIQNSRLIKLKTTKGQGLSVESFKSNYYGYIEAN